MGFPRLMVGGLGFSIAVLILPGGKAKILGEYHCCGIPACLKPNAREHFWGKKPLLLRDLQLKEEHSALERLS